MKKKGQGRWEEKKASETGGKGGLARVQVVKFSGGQPVWSERRGKESRNVCKIKTSKGRKTRGPRSLSERSRRKNEERFRKNHSGAGWERLGEGERVLRLRKRRRLNILARGLIEEVRRGPVVEKRKASAQKLKKKPCERRGGRVAADS